MIRKALIGALKAVIALFLSFLVLQLLSSLGLLIMSFDFPRASVFIVVFMFAFVNAILPV